MFGAGGTEVAAVGEDVEADVGGVAAAGGGAGGAAGDGDGGLAPAVASIMAIGLPMATVCPSLTMILVILPGTGHGMLTVALSVSSSKRA